MNRGVVGLKREAILPELVEPAECCTLDRAFHNVGSLSDSKQLHTLCAVVGSCKQEDTIAGGIQHAGVSG
jgi:hypothetical protein